MPLIEESTRVRLPVEDDPRSTWKRLREQWEKFLANGGPPGGCSVRPFVLDCWRKALQGGIDPRMPAAPLVAQADEIEEVLVQDDFACAGRRVLDDMAQVLEDHALLLSDARGRILYVAGNREVAEGLHRVNARPGGLWEENVVGPNGVGEALECRSPALIFGPEHFCENWQLWVCYGAPVRDPLSGELLGVVDLSGFAERARVNQLPVAVSMAHSVEYLLGESRRWRRQCLIDAYEAAAARWPTDALAVFDRVANLLAANRRWHQLSQRRGGRLVDPGWIANLAKTPPLGGPIPAAVVSAELGGFVEPVRVSGTPVGFLVVLQEPSSSRHLRVAACDASDLGPAFSELIGRDPEFRKALRVAARAACCDEAVLISGETGTGKELVAHAIHRASRRANRPLVCVNCAALPRDLVESELFGYEGGAFTGARREGKPGRFELADGGTLFLDEVGELPLEVQAKLLRVLEEGVVFRVGSTRGRPIDVRIVAATNRDLAAAAAKGGFRPDLFYRLDVIEIALPPLRNRGRDILELARAFLENACQRMGRPRLRFAPEVEQFLLRYSWPGNVRELRNLMSRLATLVDADVVTPDDLPAPLREGGRESVPLPPRSLQAIADELIRRTIEGVGGNISEAARRLGVDRSTIYRRLRRFEGPNGVGKGL
jgi:transcriptional regulator of acetoin/glycerol metabolism